ncbi:MAG TPA: aspartate carbamoyltransferase, partial [Bacillota bacterium]|nr:aspartate carbamoyltransferase [Bacillota bacterium]
MKHCIDIKDFTVDEINELIATAEDIIENPVKYAHACNGKKMATLFYEPSTRTRLSRRSPSSRTPR